MTQRCFHCAQAIPSDVHLHACVGGSSHAVCCIGCRAAAQWIGSLGLQDYYRWREQPADRPQTSQDFSAWDRPQLQRLYVRELVDGSAEGCVLVQGLRCNACGWLIERALRALPGVVDVAINVPARRLQVAWRRDATSLSAILGRLAQLGYTPHPLDAQSLDALDRRENRAALKRLLVAGLGMMQSMMYAVALYVGAFDGMDAHTRDFFRWLDLLVCAPVVLYAGAGFFAGAWREIAARRLGMDTPVALAIALVFAASVVETLRGGAQVYFDSASMFVFLLLGARYVESAGRRRAAAFVDALARLQPSLAQRRAESGVLETVGVHELAPGDVVVIAAGDAVPADGILLDRACDVDEALLSGESTPVRRQPGAMLVAGSIVRTGPATVRVVHVGAQTTLSAIVRLVGRAQAQRPAWRLFGDALAARFVAGVLILTFLTALGWLAFDPVKALPAALAVLVVSCPCAFALAVPAALTRALAVLARSGVLVLRPDALEKLQHVTHVIFDKTGTLTQPKLELSAIETLAGVSAARCLAVAAGLEVASSHPIAAAIRKAAHGCAVPLVRNLETSPGDGVSGTIDGCFYRLGRATFALGKDASDNAGGVVLADGSSAIARFHLGEALRPDARAAVCTLRDDGLSLAILSGDDAQHVAATAQQLGIDSYRSRATPAQKLAHLRLLRAGGATIAMVGDGVNDAPVLAGADLAIALGGGAQLAQSSADIVLAGDRLGGLHDARRIAALTTRVLRQNLYWAVAYNFLSIPLAALGYVPPWLAAIGMSMSSLAVVLNSLRIRMPHARLDPPMSPVALLPEASHA